MGLKTVGSCDRATTTCPPFLTLSAASTTLRSSRGPKATAAAVPPRRPSAVRRESTMVRALVSEGAAVCFGVGIIGDFLLAGLCWRRLGVSRKPRSPSERAPHPNSLRQGERGTTTPSPCPLPRGKRERRPSRMEELGMEGLAALVAIPEADQVALALRLLRVAERRPAVGEEAIVQVLELALLDGELDPAAGCVEDGAHGPDGLVAGLVEGLALELLGVRDEGLVVAPAQPAPCPLEDGLPRD